MSDSVSLLAFSRDVEAYLRKVVDQGRSIVLERDRRPVATLSPAMPRRRSLKEAFAALPRLSDDEAEAFARDVRAKRRMQNKEALRDPWDS